MAGCKVALIGAGSYVFGPSVLDQAILQHALPGLHLALVDVDGETLGLMANVGRRMARETGVNTPHHHAHGTRWPRWMEPTS